MPTTQVKTKTINAKAVVVARSAVGEPPNGMPRTLNGTIPI